MKEVEPGKPRRITKEKFLTLIDQAISYHASEILVHQLKIHALEALSLEANRLELRGMKMRFYQTPEGGVSYEAEERPKLGFGHERDGT